ncbi:DUF2637 domain-containing protein [Actinopolymorpha pittospori]|uniref:DUF2637 domain-containing protein n=1 Tax=Actinopolymorpha pittospori TaxID=648752 RepID=A0A927R8M5_9ACTN|nr:DUF2637 domain-containing protein [Actinopolymorpha pittospori]MBE1605554.1 hypothetical protein [Actinopolymorpha pittospori]
MNTAASTVSEPHVDGTQSDVQPSGAGHESGPWQVELPTAERSEDASAPAPPAAGEDPAELREQARQAYRESVVAGSPLTGKALGARFGRGERWGRARINEARTTTAPDPAEPEHQGGAPTSARHENAEPPESASADLPPAARDAAEAGVPDEEDGTRAAQTSGPPAHAGTAAAPSGMPADRLAGASQPRAARLVVWSAFLLGIAASIAANVAHAQPAWGPRIAGAFVPLALLLAVECMSRPSWRRSGLWWGLARYGGTGLVALVAAVISYRHMAGLLERYGEDALNAHLGPLAVDGLMVVAGFALLAINDTHAREATRSPE